MRILKINIFLLAILAAFSLLACSEQNHPPKSTASGYVQVDQGKLFYQKFGSGGTPIVVVHGGPGLDQTYLQPQMLALAKDHEVIFYDQRGSGKSLETIFTPDQITLERFTKDLEELRKELGLSKFVLLGHSWGGFLAMNYAINYPEHLSALILLSTAPADSKGQQSFVAEFTKRTQPIKNEISPLFDFQEFKKLNSSQISNLYRTIFSVYFYNPKNVAKLSLDMDENSAKNGNIVMQVMSETSWLRPNINLFPQLKKLNVPTLVIHGKEDIVPLWTAQQIGKTIPHAEIVTVEECGHFPYIEQPDQLFTQIRHFLDGIKS